MTGLFLVSSFDVGRAMGDFPRSIKPSEVRDFLIREYLRKRGGGFNHDPAILSTKGLFEGSLSQADALAYCRSSGNPLGRMHNADIISVIAPYASANISRCYAHDYLAVAVGRYKDKTIYVGLKAPFTRVQGTNAYVVFPGFRKLFAPSDIQLNIPLSLASIHFARDDFKSADVEYLDAGVSPGSTERRLRVIRGSDRKLFDRDELDNIFAVYVEGVIAAMETGLGLGPPDLSRYQVVDPNQPSFFG